jgi:hypothetical protein
VIVSRENTPDPKKEPWQTAETAAQASIKEGMGYALTEEERALMSVEPKLASEYVDEIMRGKALMADQADTLDRYRSMYAQPAGRAEMAALQAKLMQAQGPVYRPGIFGGYQSDTVGQTPTVRPSVGATEQDLQWVWKVVPAGSTLAVAVSAGMVTILPPEGSPGYAAARSLVPCLRAAALYGPAPLDVNQREAEAAVMLLSVLAYGDKDALKVVVLQEVPGP